MAKLVLVNLCGPSASAARNYINFVLPTGVVAVVAQTRPLRSDCYRAAAGAHPEVVSVLHLALAVLALLLPRSQSLGVKSLSLPAKCNMNTGDMFPQRAHA